MNIIQELQRQVAMNAGPDQVRKILGGTNVLCTPFIIDKGAYILRSRKGSGYTKRRDMTYCPVKLCNTMQRTTLVGKSMFYGVIADKQNHQENARAVSLSECSSLCRKGM